MMNNGNIDSDFLSMDVRQLKNFLSARLFSGARYRKQELVELCVAVQSLHVDPAPTQDEQQQAAEARLEEIVTISQHTKLPHPTDADLVWSATFTDVPDVSLLLIYNYFLETPSPAVSSQALKAYKSLASYRNVADGSVRLAEVSIGLPDGWVYLKGEVRASQRAMTWYKVWCLMNKKTLCIRACRCTCPAGLGEACSHAASLLFYAMMITDHGLNKPPSPTDIPCAWLPPTARKPVEGSKVSNMLRRFDSIRKMPQSINWTAPEARETRKWKLQTTYSCSRLNKQFRLPERDLAPGTSAAAAVAPDAPWSTTVDRGAVPAPAPRAEMAIPVRDLVASYLASNAGNACDGGDILAVIRSSVTEEISRNTEQATTEQGDAAEWVDQRWGRVTATKAHAIRTHLGPRGRFHLQQKTPPTCLKQVCPAADAPSLDGIPAIYWGRNHEERAVQDYVDLATTLGWHRDVAVHRAGLKIPSGEGHIGASVDRFITCSCHAGKRTVLEIKCPYSIRSLAPASEEALKKLKYLRKVGMAGRIQLRDSSAYYTQLQMQMGVWGVGEAELFVWTPKVKTNPLRPLTITCDQKFWLALKCCIDLFYARKVAPHLLSVVASDEGN